MCRVAAGWFPNPPPDTHSGGGLRFEAGGGQMGGWNRCGSPQRRFRVSGGRRFSVVLCRGVLDHPRGEGTSHHRGKPAPTVAMRRTPVPTGGTLLSRGREGSAAAGTLVMHGIAIRWSSQGAGGVAGSRLRAPATAERGDPDARNAEQGRAGLGDWGEGDKNGAISDCGDKYTRVTNIIVPSSKRGLH